MNNCYFLLFLSSLLFWCCEPEDNSVATAQMIEEKLGEKVQQLIDSKSERCWNELYTQANSIVDSVLIARARANKDTLNKPSKMAKPDLPDAFLLEDSFAIQPVIPRKDSLSKRDKLIKE